MRHVIILIAATSTISFSIAVSQQQTRAPAGVIKVAMDHSAHRKSEARTPTQSPQDAHDSAEPVQAEPCFEIRDVPSVNSMIKTAALPLNLCSQHAVGST
jgi:hypothetical protein